MKLKFNANLQQIQSREESARLHHVDDILQIPSCEKHYKTNSSAALTVALQKDGGGILEIKGDFKIFLKN